MLNIFFSKVLLHYIIHRISYLMFISSISVARISLTWYRTSRSTRLASSWAPSTSKIQCSSSFFFSVAFKFINTIVKFRSWRQSFNFLVYLGIIWSSSSFILGYRRYFVLNGTKINIVNISIVWFVQIIKQSIFLIWRKLCIKTV